MTSRPAPARSRRQCTHAPLHSVHAARRSSHALQSSSSQLFTALLAARRHREATTERLGQLRQLGPGRRWGRRRVAPAAIPHARTHKTHRQPLSTPSLTVQAVCCSCLHQCCATATSFTGRAAMFRATAYTTRIVSQLAVRAQAKRREDHAGTTIVHRLPCPHCLHVCRPPSRPC